jgi:hypothetical protein
LSWSLTGNTLRRQVNQNGDAPSFRANEVVVIRGEPVDELVWSDEKWVWYHPEASSLAGRPGMVQEAFPTIGGDSWLFTVGFFASTKRNVLGRFALFPEQALEATGFVNPTQRRLRWTRDHTLGRLPRKRGEPWRDLISLELVTELPWHAEGEEAHVASRRAATAIGAEASAALTRLLEPAENARFN